MHRRRAPPVRSLDEQLSARITSPTKVPQLLMDKSAPASERAATHAPSADIPAEWVEAQKHLSASSGLSLLLVEGRQPPSLVVSNNNSICQAFQSSPAHAFYDELQAMLAPPPERHGSPMRRAI